MGHTGSWEKVEASQSPGVHSPGVGKHSMLRGTGSWAELLAQLDAGLEVAPALAQDNLRSPGPPTEPETDHAQQTGGESIGFKFI